MTPRTAAEEALRRSRPVAFDDHDDRFVIVVEPNGEAPAPGQLRLDTDELLLARDVLDCQIVDLRGRRLTRASDVVLARTPEGGLTFAGVEVGIAAVLRRLGLGWLTGRLRHQVVPVDQLHLSSVRGHQVQLAVSTSAVYQLDAGDLSHLLTRLDVAKATEVIGQVGPQRAAEALLKSHPVVGRRLMSALPGAESFPCSTAPSAGIGRDASTPPSGVTNAPAPNCTVRRVAYPPSVGLVRQRLGVRAAAAALGALLVANVGTTCAEYAGVAAGLELFGVARTISVPIAACVVTVLVLRGSFHRVEHVLMALSAVFLAYVVSGFVAHPDWGAAGRGLLVPTKPLDKDAVLIATATLGTTLAAWGLSFIQSYAVDKRLKVEDLRWERVVVVVGAVLTGVIGLFVAIACAGTLHVQGIAVESTADATQALAPLAGGLSSTLFGIGLVGAALLAASVLPLATAYSICEFTGSESAVDDRFTDARTFYLGFIVVTGVSAAIVLLPGAPWSRCSS